MTLYIVATPLGNLRDISPRAKELFDKATLVLAEDTRTTRKLFTLLGISTDKQFLSSHAQSSLRELQKALVTCKEHEDIVLVTDAGTPAISDPGAHFINEFRSRYPDAMVVPVPGPSAAIAALSVSGFPSSHFEFFGFIPHKKGRQTMLTRIANTEHTVVFYESPHRVMKTLDTLAQLMQDRSIMVGREMTKQFEEYPRGSAQEMLDYFTRHTDKQRGEFVIVVSAKKSHAILAGQ